MLLVCKTKLARNLNSYLVVGLGDSDSFSTYHYFGKRNEWRKLQIQVPNLSDKLYTTKTKTLSLGLFLIGILGLSCLSTNIFKQQDQALAQQYVHPSLNLEI
jgi:hypothetical protein